MDFLHFMLWVLGMIMFNANDLKDGWKLAGLLWSLVWPAFVVVYIVLNVRAFFQSLR